MKYCRKLFHISQNKTGAQTTTNPSLPKLHIGEKTATKAAPAIDIPPTIQELSTKTLAIIRKTAPKIATYHHL